MVDYLRCPLTESAKVAVPNFHFLKHVIDWKAPADNLVDEPFNIVAIFIVCYKPVNLLPPILIDNESCKYLFLSRNVCIRLFHLPHPGEGLNMGGFVKIENGYASPYDIISLKPRNSGISEVIRYI